MSTYPLRVARRRPEGLDSVSLWLAVPQDLVTAFRYKTGQFVTIEEDLGGESVSRQYSLASVPGLDRELHVTIKKIDGGRMSTWLVDDVAEGDILEVATPRGRLYVPPEEPRHHLLLAAGSGIVPLYAIAREAARTAASGGPAHRITLLYGNRSQSSVLLGDEVEALMGQGIQVEHVMSRSEDGWTGAVGHLDPEFLAERWAALTDDGLPVSAYLCGPEDFMSAAEKWLVEQDVPLDDIRKESFDLVLNDDDSEPDLIVGTAEEADFCGDLTAMIMGEEVEVVPEPGERLLSALLRVSEDVPFSCQEGTCSSCIVRLVEGRVGLRPHVLQTLRESDLGEGLILACLSTARSDSVRIDFDEI